MKFLFRLFFSLSFLAVLAVGGLFAAVWLGFFGPLPTEEALAGIEQEEASLVYSRDGQLLGSFYATNRSSLRYEDFPEHLLYALIATEDARFFEHQGLDWQSMARVLVKSLLLGDRSAGGGSTLSQQLAKNLYGREKGFMAVHKIREILIAFRLESVYSKQQLLALYLNTVPFGESVYGVEMAARRFFNRSAKNISTDQAAMLVGMLKANTRYNPRLHPESALARRNVVLGQMLANGYLSEAEKADLAAKPLKISYTRLDTDGPAPYYLVQLRKEAQAILDSLFPAGDGPDLEKDGLQLTGTLDLSLQQAALQAMKKTLLLRQQQLNRQYRQAPFQAQLKRLIQQQIKQHKFISPDSVQNRFVFDWEGAAYRAISQRDSIARALLQLHAGTLAIDPQNGDVLVWVGGIHFPTQPYDQILAKRQLASTFKPFLYAAALENGLDPCTWLSNEPMQFTDQDNWQPANYDGSSGGQYSMPTALAQSLNLPAVDLYIRTSPAYLQEFWQKLGFANELPNGPATALGAVDANLLETALAYAVFANGGKKVKPRMVLNITDRKGNTIYSATKPTAEMLLSQQTAETINSMLKLTVEAGTATAFRSTYGFQGDLAAKTGTSQDYGNAWIAAYNPRMVWVSRAGNAFTAIHFNSGSLGSGSKLALPLVGYALNEVQKQPDLRKKYQATLPGTTLDCATFRETPLLDKIFSQEQKNLEKAQKKAIRKEKRQKWFKKLLGRD